MSAPAIEDEVYELDDSSWVYLSLWNLERRAGREVHRQVVEVCEASGWPAVSWSPPAHDGNVTDSARYFEGMAHAVEHADLVVVLVDGPSAMTDAELAFAYSHHRPVVGLRVASEEMTGSDVQGMLHRYRRAWLVDAPDIEGCLTGLREALGDPEFRGIVRDAAKDRLK